MSISPISSVVKRQAKRRRPDEPALEPRDSSSHCVVPVISEIQDGATQSVMDLRPVIRKAIAITPVRRRSFREQVLEVFSLLEEAVGSGPSESMTVTAQTVFLNSEENRAECEVLFREHFGKRQPVTTYVLQPPCARAGLAVETWALGGPQVAVERHSPTSLSVSYEGLRWTHCGGIEARSSGSRAHDQSLEVLNGLRQELQRAGVAMSDIVRTWFYQGGINAADAGEQRYHEFNRARTERYHEIRFDHALVRDQKMHAFYPASTGIGMRGRGLVAGCLALRTNRSDARLLPLENPDQVPAYHYDSRYSPESPKFSRAMAVLLHDYDITWISGTASIVNSESSFPGDIERQTHQTLDNIERLISPENFTVHGAPGAGATLNNLAKVRVYVRRPEDYPRCRAVCEQRLGRLPAIFAVADICRPELLVEIEGVAFSRPDQRDARTLEGRQ